MSEKHEHDRNGSADRSDERENDSRSSLDRLAEFTRRILRVTKSDLPIHKTSGRPNSVSDSP